MADKLADDVKALNVTGEGVKVHKLGDFTLQSGKVLENAFIAYKTHGDSSKPAIVYPSWYSGLISDNEWLIGKGKALDPENFYIIIPALFGNSQSTSPSNSTQRPFPAITLHDNVKAQHKLVTEHLGIKHLRMVLGWSMGAQQTFQWSVQFPEMMDIIIPFCGSAKTSIHNYVFLEGVKAALTAPMRAGADMTKKESWEVGLKSFARVYAGWGFSQDWYRQKEYLKMGFKDLEDFMVNFWEKWALSKNPENLLCMLDTWQTGDCSKQEPFNGNFKAAMGSIKAKALILPGKTDLYFPPEDSEEELLAITTHSQMVPFPSNWGHWAGGPGDNPIDVKWLDEQIKGWLAKN